MTHNKTTFFWHLHRKIIHTCMSIYLFLYLYGTIIAIIVIIFCSLDSVSFIFSPCIEHLSNAAILLYRFFFTQSLFLRMHGTDMFTFNCLDACSRRRTLKRVIFSHLQKGEGKNTNRKDFSFLLLLLCLLVCHFLNLCVVHVRFHLREVQRKQRVENKIRFVCYLLWLVCKWAHA